MKKVIEYSVAAALVTGFVATLIYMVVTYGVHSYATSL